MLLVAEIMPATSDSVPLIGKPKLKLKGVTVSSTISGRTKLKNAVVIFCQGFSFITV